jgi:hypothetical protein
MKKKGPRNQQAIKNYLETSNTCGCFREQKISKTELDLLIHKSDDPNTTKRRRRRQHNPSLFIK